MCPAPSSADGDATAAAIFDLDGTLVDSQALSDEAWRDVVASYGYRVRPGEVRALQGLRDADIHAYFATRVPLLGAAVTAEDFTTVFLQKVDAGLDAFDDAVTAARALREQGYALGIASSSARARVDHLLRAVGLEGLFAAIVCGDEVPRGKPAPDVYLAVARTLGVAPARCVAIEDSRFGVEAARRAGMKVIGVRRPRSMVVLDRATVSTDRITAAQVTDLLRVGPIVS